MDKQAYWDDIVAQLDQLRDGSGLGVDPGIKGCVVGLNALGITTLMSCEGHTDTILAAPWVTIVHSEFDEWDDRREAAGDDEEEQERIAIKITELTSQCAQKLLNYLADFYRQRQVDFDRRLMVYPEQATVIAVLVLTTQGAVLQLGRDLEVRERCLEKYQDEMRAFANFLKEQFFSPNFALQIQSN